MPTLTMDARRRITLPEHLVDDPRQKFVAIKVRGDIILKPLPKDPLATLEKEGEKIPKHLSIADLKRIAREAAVKEAMGNWERLEKLSKKKG